MEPVRLKEDGTITYEPNGEDIIATCPVCSDEVEINEWTCGTKNSIETIVGGYCYNCCSIINEKLLDIEIIQEE